MRLACCLLLVSLGCASSPEDDPRHGGVRLASTFGEVAGCVDLGPVEASVEDEDAAINLMMNQTAARGGNALYVNTAGVKPGRSGIAYRCSL